MKCIVVDDDIMTVKILENFIKETDSLELITSCSSAIEASNVLRKEEADLVFLDVEMPQMTGMELLDTLEKRPQIVLVSSHEKYAVDAFSYQVADYIVKPVKYNRFMKAVNRVKEIIEKEKPVLAAPAEEESDSLFVRVASQYINIKYNDIKFIEAKADYVTINTESGRYTVYSTMKGILSKLPDAKFSRVHRSFIVNNKRIETFEDNTLVVGNKLIPVGVTYREKLMKKINFL